MRDNQVKKIIKAAVALVLAILTAIPSGVIGTIDNYSVQAAWDGTVATKFSYGSGTQTSPYEIRSSAEYAYFLQNIESGITFEGVYFRLACDIDMTGGTMTEPTGIFGGIFDGNGKTITASVPFTRIIGENAVVKLLNYQTTQAVTNELLCYTNKGAISSCIVRGDIYVCDDEVVFYKGLLCNSNMGLIQNSAAIGNIETDGDDSDSRVGTLVYSNSGTINNSYAAVSFTFSTHGRYSIDYGNGFAYENSGTINNCYYDSGINSHTTEDAVPLKTEELTGSDFVDMLNETNPTLESSWVSDTSGINGGYPMLIVDEKIEETVSMSYSTDSYFTYHSSSFSTKLLLSSSRSCKIYYTLDGTDPRSSSTRKVYTSGYITVSGDAEIKTVAYYNGVYGRVTIQNAVSMLGSGTEADPYRVNDKNDLIAIALEPTAHYVLTSDIVFTDSDYTSSGVLPNGWMPIGGLEGVIDGDGHKIVNLQGRNGGFVSYNKGTITNICFTEMKIKGGGTFGPVADTNVGTLSHIYADLDIITLPVQTFGGIVGSNVGDVEYCNTTGTVCMAEPSSPYARVYAGGIAGSGWVSRCYSDLKVTVGLNGFSRAEFVFFGGMTGSSSSSNCAANTYCKLNLSLSYDVYIGPIIANTYNYSAPNSYGTVSYSVSGNYGGGKYINNAVTYGYKSVLESDYPEFDFTDTWMITPDGPRPQGIMNADGKCLYKYSYTAPTCTEDGVARYIDQDGNITSETLPSLGHGLNQGVCQRSGCDYKQVYTVDLTYEGEIVDALSLYRDREYRLEAVLTPADALDKTLTWESSDTAVAEVTDDGLIETVGEGSAVITVTAASGVKKTVDVTVTESPYLNKLALICDETATVGDSGIDMSAVFSTNKAVNFIYAVLYYPDGLKLSDITAVDFATVEKELEVTEDGVTTLILNCLYSETEMIPKNEPLTPFALTFDVAKTAAHGTLSVGFTEETIIGGNDAYMFEELIPASLKVAPKLVESITIVGADTISEASVYEAVISPDYASDMSVIWSVDKEIVAKVDGNGVLTPVTSGQVVLRAEAIDGSGAYAEKTVNIICAVASLRIEGPDRITEPSQYTATVIPEYATEKLVAWSVSDDAIAKVDENGVLTPVTSGQVVLRVSATDGSGVYVEKTVEIVKLAERIEIAGAAEISVPTQYKATVLPDYTTDKSVVWSVDDESIARVDENGVLTPVAGGEVLLIATAKDGSSVSGSISVKIVKYAESLTVIGANSISEPSQYTAEVLPDYTTDKSVVWSVDDASVASVDENGLLTPHKNGSVILTAVTSDGTGLVATKTVTVTVSVRLTSLVSNIGVWDKEFDSNVTEYTIYLTESASAIKFTSGFSDATLKINGLSAFNNIAKTMQLTENNTVFEFKLTPTSGSTLAVGTYTVTVVNDSEPTTRTVVSEDKRTFTVDVSNVDNGSLVILALYSGDRFVGMQTAVYSGDKLIFETDKAYTTAKIMVWRSANSMTPVTEAEIIG